MTGDDQGFTELPLKSLLAIHGAPFNNSIGAIAKMAKSGGDGVARWGPTTCAQHSSRPLGLDKYLLSLFETLTQNVKA